MANGSLTCDEHPELGAFKTKRALGQHQRWHGRTRSSKRGGAAVNRGRRVTTSRPRKIAESPGTGDELTTLARIIADVETLSVEGRRWLKAKLEI